MDIEQESHEDQLQQSDTAQTSFISEDRLGHIQQVIFNANKTEEQEASNQLGIADRCNLWKEQREKRLRDAQMQREIEVHNAQGCTFKPQIAKPLKIRGQKTFTQQDFDTHLAADNQKNGFDSYLQRMDKAKEMREDKLKLEEKLFQRDKKWKPTLTQPREPKLSAFINKKDRDVTVKSLSKPVDALGSTQDMKGKWQITEATEEESEGRNTGMKDVRKSQDYFAMAKKNKSQYVEIKPDMSFEEAVSLIHQHILNLDI